MNLDQHSKKIAMLASVSMLAVVNFQVIFGSPGALAEDNNSAANNSGTNNSSTSSGTNNSTDSSTDSQSSSSSTPTPTANPLKEGIKAFKAGDFRNAIGLLGSAQSTDFNNPVLHYYMANAFVRLGRREPCIREYRIAYALAPDQEVGQNSKRALMALGVASFEEGPPSGAVKKTEFELPKKDPAFEKALEALGKQSRDVMSNDRGAMAVENWKKKMSTQIQDAIIKSLLATKKGTVMLPQDSLMLLDQLREINNTDRYAKYYYSDTKTREVQKSAENLGVLLKDTKGTHRLVPQGTNLYVRNYKSAAGKDKKPTNTTGTGTIMDTINQSLPK